jgi:hypothetical protein
MAERHRPCDALSRPALARPAWVFARFGNAVFGGGTPTIAVIEREVVDHRGWLDRRWTHLLFCVLASDLGHESPGVQHGYRMAHKGALVALAVASVPCSIFAIALTRHRRMAGDGYAGSYRHSARGSAGRYIHNRRVRSVTRAIVVAIAGLVLVASLPLAREYLIGVVPYRDRGLRLIALLQTKIDPLWWSSSGASLGFS